MKNGIQLITYPDSLGTNLKELHEALEGPLKGCVKGVHILPFFPSSGDRGFSPLGYKEVDSAFGGWEDIRRISSQYDLVVDFMVNHLSRQSAEFKDFAGKGDDSPWAGLFLPVDRVKPEGEFTTEELAKIYTRKPRAPWIEITHDDGTPRKVWCTFSEEQIDLDIKSETGKNYILDSLNFLADQGAAMIRLDAFAYVTKKVGTSCFFLEPEIWEILGEIRDEMAKKKVELLPEIHEHYSIPMKLADKGYSIYDFALPMLVLHALYSGRADRLGEWLVQCPSNQYTTLDTHDGIGVVDVADLLTPEEVEMTCSALYEKGSNVNRRYSSAEYNNLDIYQINCTYYSALGEDDQAYLLARAIQFFAPGIPQVYYVGMLAGANDIDLVEETKNGRDINRHGFTLDEIAGETERPVVAGLMSLMKLRNSHHAFAGDFEVLASSAEGKLSILRSLGDQSIRLDADLGTKEFSITEMNSEGERVLTL
ncbi:MAG: sucrose phosphorylase [Spirochaetales bacterium]|nr:sucrose phosphorylase [Spirochaetales bacterium]